MLVFSHICSPEFITGAEKLLLSFLRELHRLFHCVLVVPREGAIAEAARRHGVEIAVLDIPLSIAMYIAAPHLSAELDNLRRHTAWEQLVALLQREEPSYVWVNTCVHPLPAMAAKALGVPTIWSLMETINDGSHRDEAARIVATYSDRIVGISKTVLAPIPSGAHAKAAVLPPFLNREELLPDSWPMARLRQRRSQGWSEHHLVAGYIASALYPNKGLKDFVQAMLPLAALDSRVRLLVIGNPDEDADYVRSCRELIQKAGLADRVSWIRFADRIEYVYPMMDVVVVPSLIAEGFGMTALEGMVFGKPVVAYASGGLEEILQATGNAAYLVKPGDISGLTTAIATLLQNEKLRSEVGAAGARAAEETFGRDAFREQLTALVSGLPARQPPALQGLVRGRGPTVYYIEHGRRRSFPSEAVFHGLGFRFEDVQDVPDHRLSLIPHGPPMELPAAENRGGAGEGAGASRRSSSSRRSSGGRGRRARRGPRSSRRSRRTSGGGRRSAGRARGRRRRHARNGR
ncbi:glycosyltransferase family 4 protein [Cohnella fermenti]|nr:glycosyltransferase family 4 protein [Cohnella fermenti]